MPFETFEHTADLGLRVTAATLPELYAESGRALFSVLIEDMETISPVEKTCFTICQGRDCSEEEARANLLVDWLGELLFCFETEHKLFSRFVVQWTDKGLDVEAWGETIDPARHTLELDVKAITYHGLFVQELEDRFEAEVIVDL